MKIEKFEDIEAWKEARELVKSVYKVCSVIELKKDYALSDQIKRAGVSIMANIAEGFSRRGNKEFIQFLFIAKASAAELQSHLYIALDQQYIDKGKFDMLYTQTDKLQRKLSNCIKYLTSTLTHKSRKSNNPTNPMNSINSINPTNPMNSINSKP
ncbi:MAG: four helix bundle protein [Candidatus Bathyarchaeia archaeon]|nr:four helix bundle protein [Candidatus Jingweiarchaeum tengchongense]